MTTYPIIINGDHAEFERENANTPPKERSDWPLPSFDARDWAEAFTKRFIVSMIDGYQTKPVDDQDGIMIAWFANALMRGFDEKSARASDSLRLRVSALEEALRVARGEIGNLYRFATHGQGFVTTDRVSSVIAKIDAALSSAKATGEGK